MSQKLTCMTGQKKNNLMSKCTCVLNSAPSTLCPERYLSVRVLEREKPKFCAPFPPIQFPQPVSRTKPGIVGRKATQFPGSSPQLFCQNSGTQNSECWVSCPRLGCPPADRPPQGKCPGPQSFPDRPLHGQPVRTGNPGPPGADPHPARAPAAALFPPRRAPDPGVLPPALTPGGPHPRRPLTHTASPPPPPAHAHMLITAPTPGRSRSVPGPTLTGRCVSPCSRTLARASAPALLRPQDSLAATCPRPLDGDPSVWARGVALPHRDSKDEGSRRGRRPSPWSLRGPAKRGDGGSR